MQPDNLHFIVLRHPRGRLRWHEIQIPNGMQQGRPPEPSNRCKKTGGSRSSQFQKQDRNPIASP